MIRGTKRAGSVSASCRVTRVPRRRNKLVTSYSTKQVAVPCSTHQKISLRQRCTPFVVLLLPKKKRRKRDEPLVLLLSPRRIIPYFTYPPACLKYKQTQIHHSKFSFSPLERVSSLLENATSLHPISQKVRQQIFTSVKAQVPRL